MYYFYDEKGDVAGFEYNGSAYYYQKNMQGDVLRICGEYGGIVAQYTYDAWGKVLSVADANGNAITSETHVANLNPFRYRSYYYDTETGFYYLNSRYYDPEVGRFLNADGIVGADGGITGYNMFAYCSNNPVIYNDPSGNTSAICLGDRSSLGFRDPWRDAGGAGGVCVSLSVKPKSQNTSLAAKQTDGLINGQGRLPYADERVGLCGTYGSSGCAVIATYNALQLLGKPKSLKKICDEYFWRYGMIAFGAGGVGPWSIERYLRGNDIPYKGYFTYGCMTNDLVSGDVVIFTIMNDKDDLFQGFHTMAASYDGSMFTVYNVNNWSVQGKSVSSLCEYDIISNGAWIYGFRIWNNG